MTSTIAAAAAAAAAVADFGEPSARKTGRDERWPYVPVMLDDDGVGGRRQRQLLGVAFATRDEAVQFAVEHVARARAELARQLAEPRFRALREQHGLPRDI